MTRKLARFFVITILITLTLAALSLVIWYFVKGSITTLKDIMFYVGAVPVASFALARLGDFKGRGHLSYQMSSSVTGQSANQRSVGIEKEGRAQFRKGLSPILAGLLIWLVSYLI